MYRSGGGTFRKGSPGDKSRRAWSHVRTHGWIIRSMDPVWRRLRRRLRWVTVFSSNVHRSSRLAATKSSAMPVR